MTAIRPGGRRAAATLQLIALSCVAGVARAGAQTVWDAHEEAKQLVVMVSCQSADEVENGAGLIFGAAHDTLYIATAEHVVRGCKGRPDGVQVLLRSRPDAPVPGMMTSESDSALDLTVLRVLGAKRAGLDPDSLPFDRLGAPDSLKRGDRVYSLGRRNRPWALNVNWEPFAEREGNRLYYESNFIGPGHSGGAFLDEDLLLVGMIRSDQPPNGEAVSITSILDRVRQWRYPVRLTRPTLPAAFASLAVGSDHTCGLTADGAAYCWGLNGGGALGTGVFGGRSKRVMGRLRFRSLSAASGMTCGVTTDDAAYCWGLAIWNSEAGADNRQLTPTPVPGGRRFRSVSVGDNHVCGLAPDGSAFCWGENELGQLGNGSRGKSVTPVPVAGNLKFKSISVGENHNCALTGDGIAYCWGQNLNGEVGVGSIRMVVSPVAVAGDLRFSSISASPTGHTCGVAITGQAYCWGLARSGALGNGSGGDTETNSLTPSAVAGALTFASLTTGAWYSCGIVTTGATYCWGNNEDGQLGNGGTEGSRAPVETAGKLRFASLSTSSFYGKLICGLTTQGAPYCWGRTDEQQQVGAAFPNDVAVRVPTAVRP